MSQESTRRPSTGGLPPFKIREQYVVEEAPSHDSTPCFSAWGWSSTDFSISDKGPKWSIQIYDTMLKSDNASHLKTLAEALHRETREEAY
ncbi:hypothetical protein K458DRAFT_385718 [Lentithecium fluviatile CBS 122367]|uniref:Uncharacterized protein n=1 Tax=Lentithecium fluviatile CBS 122367 TaxID=1168545 RepID=A0A6G1JCJ3_9PLEO|nr:hypothetical protein K458DRAFT_385718 [Lentithecium fluviatile CBS 122367]